jgi:2'-5' RNA ligase
MAKIAVDIVLLPSEEVTDQAIEANKRLSKRYADRIILDKENCLPHISLAMGCINERDISNIERILQSIAEKYNPGRLNVIGINTSMNSFGEKVRIYSKKNRKTSVAS